MSAFALKIIAMVTMFIDHLFASCIDPYGVDVWNISRHIVPGTGTTLYWIGRMIGRIAFPIFCFQCLQIQCRESRRAFDNLYYLTKV